MMSHEGVYMFNQLHCPWIRDAKSLVFQGAISKVSGEVFLCSDLVQTSGDDGGHDVGEVFLG